MNALSEYEDWVAQRLIERLKRVEAECAGLHRRLEQVKKKRGRKSAREKQEIAGLYEREDELKREWRNVKNQLHKHFKPIILRRDGYRCRVCGSAKKLELARLFDDSFYDLGREGKMVGLFRIERVRRVEERYSPKNMFILCAECHRLFHSHKGCWARRAKTVDEVVERMREIVQRHEPANVQYEPGYYTEEELLHREARAIQTAFFAPLLYADGLGEAPPDRKALRIARVEKSLKLIRQKLSFFRNRGVIDSGTCERFLGKLEALREGFAAET